MQQRMASLRSEIATLQTEITTLQNDRTTLKNEISTLQNDRTSLNNEITTLQSDRTSLNNEILTLRNDRTNLNIEITTLQNERTNLNNENTTLKEENNSLKSNFSKGSDCLRELFARFNSDELTIINNRDLNLDNLLVGLDKAQEDCNTAYVDMVKGKLHSCLSGIKHSWENQLAQQESNLSLLSQTFTNTGTPVAVINMSLDPIQKYIATLKQQLERWATALKEIIVPVPEAVLVTTSQPEAALVAIDQPEVPLVATSQAAAQEPQPAAQEPQPVAQEAQPAAQESQPEVPEERNVPVPEAELVAT